MDWAVDSGACSGTVVWSPDSAGTPIGTYTVVAQLDGTTEQTGAFINVALTVYDVYSYDFSPFYPGDDTSTQNQTIVNYQLSGQVPSSNVTVDGETLQGSGNSGDNAVTWNGTIDTQNDYCASGAYPIAISPQVGNSDIIVGQPLSIASPTVWDISALSPVQTNSFDPSAGEYLEIDYQIAEPVQRPQASAAYVTAMVYDMDANVVATLAEGAQTASIDTSGNNSSQSGQNTLVWDGTNDNGDAADPGFYTVTIVAEDNAGVGCESLLNTISVQLLPSQACEIQACFNKEDGQESVMGSTNSGNSVSWTDSVGGNVVASGACNPGQDGSFSFLLTDSTPGLHTITLNTTSQQTQQTTQQSLSELINDIAVSAPTTAPGSAPFAEAGRFSPVRGQSVSVTLTSQIADSFDVEIVNPFNAPTCIDPANPTKASDFLNGGVSEQVIKTWSVTLAAAGQATVTWDGTDSNFMQVPAGPYVIRVSRANADEFLAASFDTSVTVDGSGSSPAIPSVSNTVIGTSVAICWQTAVPTQGAVSYSEGDTSVGRISVTDLSTFHTVYLPITDSGITYTYWVVAQDADGNTSVSQAGQVTTGSGESFGDVCVTPVSDSAVNVTWSSSANTAGRVEYACVGSTLSWQTANDATVGQQHAVQLAGLAANSEYVFRAESASDTSFASASVSQYFDLITKTSLPSVSIVSPTENQSVSGTVNVTVAASDPIQRFPDNGITSVELCVDGVILTPYSYTSGSSYLFSVDTSNLGRGVHQIVAYATDDFWNTATYVTDVFVTTVNSAANEILSSQPSGGSTPSAATLGGALAKGSRPIEHIECTGLPSGKPIHIVWCRGRFANTTHKEWHFRAGGQIDAATNWAKGFCDRAPSRITGAVNGSFYDWYNEQTHIGPTEISGDLWEKNYGGNMAPTDNSVDATHPWRFCVGFNELGSQHGVQPMQKYNQLRSFDYARSNVICMLYNGQRKDDTHSGSPVRDKNEADWRTLLVWGSSQPNRLASGGVTGEEFFLISADLETWNTMKDFLHPGGPFLSDSHESALQDTSEYRYYHMARWRIQLPGGLQVRVPKQKG